MPVLVKKRSMFSLFSCLFCYEGGYCLIRMRRMVIVRCCCLNDAIFCDIRGALNNGTRLSDDDDANRWRCVLIRWRLARMYVDGCCGHALLRECLSCCSLPFSSLAAYNLCTLDYKRFERRCRGEKSQERRQQEKTRGIFSIIYKFEFAARRWWWGDDDEGVVTKRTMYYSTYYVLAWLFPVLVEKIMKSYGGTGRRTQTENTMYVVIGFHLLSARW